MAIVLLAGWPAVAGAEGVGNTALVLHPDAYSYDNEGHASSWGQTTTAPGGVQVRGQATETWDTALVLHPDAYSYDNEGHASLSGQPTTAPVIEATQETVNTALVLHPDAYWYNNEDHTPSALEASTPAVQLASPAR